MTITYCASIEIVNMSPESTIPSIPDFKTINAAIRVTCSDPLISANEDVANFLNRENVFGSVIASSSKNTLSVSDLELFVVPKIIEDYHFSERMGKAVLRGLTFGLADKTVTDSYKYTVILKVILKKGATILSTYEAIGKYYAQWPVNSKEAQTQEARAWAWEHAIMLLTGKIKRDRNKIVDFLKHQ